MSIENSLDFWDRNHWRSDKHYSSRATHCLTRARTILTAARDTYDLEHVIDILTSCLTERMMYLQQLNVFSLLSLSYRRAGETSDAKQCADIAIEIATKQQQLYALIDLLLLRGSAARVTSDFGEAARDYLAAFREIDRLPRSEYEAQLPKRVRIHALLAGYLFYLARYAEAQWHAATGMHITPSGDWFHASALNSLLALAYRWTDQPELAYELSTKAVDRLIDQGDKCSLVRAQTVRADAAIDLALRYATQSPAARARYLAFAAEAIQSARAWAEEGNDPNGIGLVATINARYTVVRGGDLAFAEREIDDALAIARRVNDGCVVAQAFTALGEVQLAKGDHYLAVIAFRCARSAAEQSRLPALNHWIDRGLHTAREFAD